VGAKVGDIDDVILVGGQTRMPAVLEAVKYRIISIFQHRLFGDILIKAHAETRVDARVDTADHGEEHGSQA
jgi:chromatin segregation and condensation protein Rec8/ScpA/Scc1 (kleisin family)